jgi:hypothetical protein
MNTLTGAMMSNHSPIATSAIDFFNRVEGAADQIISELPDMADDEILEVRQGARTLGRMAWRVEFACDSEILNRESMRRGRGIRDEEGKGVDAAVRKHAAALGVHPRTIYGNASVHKTFFNSASANSNKLKDGLLDILEDADFYRAAMQTEDPHATIEKYAQEKTKNPFFSTRDAWRMNKEATTPPLDQTVPALCDQEDVVEAWGEFQDICRKLATVAPRLRGLINGYLEEVQYELTVPPQTVEQTIYELLRQGWDEVDQVAERMKKDRIHVQVWLNRLCEIGKLESFEKERAPGARGAARTGYREIID